MLLAEPVLAKLNEQIVNEFGASQSYLAMAAQCKSMGLHLLSDFLRKQAVEEREHAEKIFDYILDREGAVQLGAIPAPKAEYASVVEMLATAKECEMTVSRQIEDLVRLADEHDDLTTQSFLDWFLTEQIEEVSTMHKMHQAAVAAGPAIIQVEAYLVHLA